MKTKMKFLTVVAVLIAGFTSCRDREDLSKNDEGEVRGDETVVQLNIADGVIRGYGAGSNVQAPKADENKLAATIDIYVFDANGQFEYKAVGVSPSQAFQITAGKKYFYIFSNAPKNVKADIGDFRDKFEKQGFKDAFSATRPDIATANAFFIGTLWGEQVQVLGNGTKTKPEVIKLKVGRIAAQVNLASVVTTASGVIKGEFSSPAYRLRSVPDSFYLVGQWKNVMPPAMNSDVTSAAHEEPSGTAAAPNKRFIDYKTWNAPNTPFYTVENTTKPDAKGMVFFGNTTYMQLRVVYTPDASTVYDGVTGNKAASGIAKGSTFWTGTVNNETRIYNGNPTNISGVTDPKEYSNGEMYYSFAIKDATERVSERVYSVLRNHYYEVTVSSIANLGENTDKVDPEKPVNDLVDVKVEIEVLPWSKILQDVSL
ncbi:MAG: Mfa1 family fimbria major subunit [Bacteroidales bacterium]|jgi:hypothetical protein|nr:Mfa1 family fimbria major subunit [Bacteroidales bacterium]